MSTLQITGTRSATRSTRSRRPLRPRGRSEALRLPRQRTAPDAVVTAFSRPVGAPLTVRVPLETPTVLPDAVTAPEPAGRPTVRPITRLTRRGRLVLVLAFLGLVLAAMTALGGFATATHGSGSPEPVRVVEVAPGDTLYSIAGEVAEPGQVRSMVHRIQELNSLSGATLQVGQRLAVPEQ